MNISSIRKEGKKKNQRTESEDLCYQYEGYTVRVCFSEKKTLVQCIKKLIEHTQD